MHYGLHAKLSTALGTRTTSYCALQLTPPSVISGIRTVRTSSVDFQDLSYEDLVALLKGGNIQLVDVREPAEVAASGKIGNAINIPLGQVKDALLLSDEDFQKTYHAPKPQSYDHNIVFYGLGPIKSQAALKLAIKAGYEHAREYSGGWQEYQTRKNS